MPIPYAEDEFNHCHANAARWVTPGYEVVRGWLLWPGAGSPHMLHAHSVVRGSAGLVDVTPLRAPGLHFLEHEGGEEEFLALAKNFAQHTHGLDFTQAVLGHSSDAFIEVDDIAPIWTGIDPSH
jgi:hypothetical protein